jgi:hypothetical protein
MFKKTKKQLEDEFFLEARKAGRLPSTENKKKARKAFEKLPAGSKFLNVDFEGKPK